MTLFTYGDLKEMVKNDLDLQDEQFIDDDMLIAWFNNGIDEAEQHVLGENQDYFLQTENLALVQGTSEYALPSNILAHKIRKVFYDNGNEKYEIKRIRKLEIIPSIESGESYRYLIITNSSGNARIKLYPAADETSSANVSLWFIGNANRITDDDTVINIPEAVNFILSYVKLECLRREGNPGQVAMEQERERQRRLLIETLSSMVLDEDNEILLDTSFYDDMV